MPPKAHLTSHSRCLALIIVVISVKKIFFVQFYCVFLSSLIIIFCFCYIHTISVLYCAHLCMKCSLDTSNFPEEISSPSHSIVFLYFFALITEEGFLISPCYSLELCIQIGISFLFSFASSDNHFAFLRIFFLGMVLIPASCTMSGTSIHSSSGTLSDLTP